MALEYSIYENSDNYYEVSIPVASYYRDEGLLLNATVYNHWKGFNDESFAWQRIEDKIVLFDDEGEKVIDELSLEEVKEWLNNLSNTYSHIDMFKPIIDILEILEIDDKARISIGFY